MAKRGPKPKNRTPMTDSLVITKEPEMEELINATTIKPTTTPCTHECHQEKRLEILERIVACIAPRSLEQAHALHEEMLDVNRLRLELKERLFSGFGPHKEER